MAAQVAPERLRTPRFKHRKRRALLLYPCVVAKVENTVAVSLGAINHGIGLHSSQMFRKDFCSFNLREVVIETLFHCLDALARIQICAVCSNGDEHIVFAETK